MEKKTIILVLVGCIIGYIVASNLKKTTEQPNSPSVVIQSKDLYDCYVQSEDYCSHFKFETAGQVYNCKRGEIIHCTGARDYFRFIDIEKNCRNSSQTEYDFRTCIYEVIKDLYRVEH